jgi:hydroxymethylpyrimidine pyrophosphatase-like HAD family hydrolase
VLAATARRSSSASALFSSLDLDLPAVLLNGALGRARKDRAIFHRAPFSPEDATLILERFVANGVTPCLYLESSAWDVVSGPMPSAGRAYLDGVQQHLKLVDNLAELCSSFRVYEFSVVGVEEPTFLRQVQEGLLGQSRPPEVVLSPDGRIGGTAGGRPQS